MWLNRTYRGDKDLSGAVLCGIGLKNVRVQWVLHAGWQVMFTILYEQTI